MASITKKSDGKYLIRVSKGTGKARTMINHTFRGPLKKAKDWAREQETLIDSGKHQNSDLTFEAYRKLWLAVVKKRLAPLTYDNYEGNLRRNSETIDAIKLGDIRTHHIQAIYNELAPAVLRSLHATFNACFGYAVKREYIRVNPCKNTDRPQRKRPDIVVLTELEAIRFIKIARIMPGGLIFEFALHTGMRPEEYLGLRWSDIHGSEITVEQIVQYNRKGGGFYFAPPKTPKSRRRVPISEDLRKRLITHRRLQNEHRLAMKGTWFNHNLVFPNIVGNPQTIPNMTQRYFAPIVEKCRFNKHLTPYGLRHTCATLLLLGDVNVKIVSERLGHASIALTLDTYSHVLPGMQADATDVLDRMLRVI